MIEHDENEPIPESFDRQLEVYRRPELDPEDPGQWYYAERVIDQAEDRVTPIVLPDHRIGVKDLLPRKTIA